MESNNNFPPRRHDSLQAPIDPNALALTASSDFAYQQPHHHDGPSDFTGRSRGATAGTTGSGLSGPITPGAVEENRDAAMYLEPVAATQSVRSQASIRSHNPGSDLRPSNSTGSTGRRGRARYSPSIRIRRSPQIPDRQSSRPHQQPQPLAAGNVALDRDGRPRSISQPERSYAPPPAMHSRGTPQIVLPRLTEEGNRPTLEELEATTPMSPSRSLPNNSFPEVEEEVLAGPVDPRRRKFNAGRVGRFFWPGGKKNNQRQEIPLGDPGWTDVPPEHLIRPDYEAELVDWLDTIDPEVQTLSTLTNVQNSLFVPDLGGWLNRRPTYSLSTHEPDRQSVRPTTADATSLAAVPENASVDGDPSPYDPSSQAPRLQRSNTLNTITSRLTESHYATLPHGETLEGWSAEDKSELDDHVRHMLHSKRSKFKRRLRGFGQYVKRPLGFFVTLYATLITLFGLAWVLFLIGWIEVGSKQSYTIFVIDSVLVALFAVMGDGLAPFRAVDTYHLFFVVRYTRRIRRMKQGKPPPSKLHKKNVPPDVRASFENSLAHRDNTSGAWQDYNEEGDARASPVPASEHDSDPILADIEAARNSDINYPLTPKEQESLEYHRGKLAKSHSFYKPDETFTHYSFPLEYLIAIVVLLDCHSCLQISLGACTWGIDYHVRPFALTTVILCVSITCNITAGLVITIGDRKTRKKDVHKLINRQELTGDAIKEIEAKKKKKEEEEEKEREKEQDKERESEEGDSPTSPRLGHY